MRISVCFTLVAGAAAIAATIPESLRSGVTFHASFNTGVQADVARGDRQIYNAPDYKRQAEAKSGVGDLDVAIENNALRFRSKNTRALFFKGERHVSPRAGTVSFWLRLDPDKDLAPGFCDPIQVTGKAYNDSAIWVDFTKDDVPRHFRLGVFGPLKSWNPTDIPPDKNPSFLKRLVVVERPPFTREKWTHVAITWSGLDSAGGSSALFLDGKQAPPSKTIAEAFDWNSPDLAIRLGVNYTGLMDEVVAFDRALSASDVAMLFKAGREK